MASKTAHRVSRDEPTVPSVDPSFSPETNFYMYVNAKWQRSVKMPDYEDDFGISEEIELDLRNQLLHALTKHCRMHPSDGLSRLATSFLDSRVQETAVSDLSHLLNSFDCIDSSETLGKAIGYMNKIQCRAPFSLVVNSDYFDSKKCCIYLYEPTLGLPSKHDYEDHSSNRALRAYSHFLKTVGDHLHVSDLQSCIRMEADLIPLLSDMSELRNIEYSYNPCSLSELRTDYPHIPMDIIAKTMGIKDPESVKYIVTNTKFFRFLNRMFHTPDFGRIALWCKSMVINHYVKYLPPPFDDLHYHLFEKLLKGVNVKLPQSVLTLKVLMTFAQQDLSRMFVRLVVPETTKESATQIVQLLKAATARRIRGLHWMEPSTKRAALRKVSSMTFQVAYPGKWSSETAGVEIDSGRPFQNLVELASADTHRMLEDLHRHGCRKHPEKWRDGAFEVNAYYYPEGNMMVIPAGILRAPFFDKSRSMAWNLGAIGVAISHEITHGFDDDGRVFDEHGNYADWWTKSDEETYRNMSRAVVKLFDGQKYMGGKVDGELTLNENIADLGGMAIALDALKAILPADPAAQKTAYCDFFTGFAVSWRQKERPKKAKQALLLDVHAPPLYRVNLIVAQFEEFYNAFDIRPGEKGYVPASERVVFW
jgi:predicted metalloendopeptidase